MVVDDRDFHGESGWTLWFTGLPCAGKTSIVQQLSAELRGLSTETHVLDGDDLRSSLCSDLGFSRKDRDENVSRIGWTCNLLNEHRINVLAAVVSPYRDARARLRFANARLFEIYVRAPLSVCMQRDSKGMYAKALAGNIRNFTGVDDPYEEPLNPDLIVDTSLLSLEESALKILRWMEDKALVDMGAVKSRQPVSI